MLIFIVYWFFYICFANKNLLLFIQQSECSNSTKPKLTDAHNSNDSNNNKIKQNIVCITYLDGVDYHVRYCGMNWMLVFVCVCILYQRCRQCALHCALFVFTLYADSFDMKILLKSDN